MGVESPKYVASDTQGELRIPVSETIFTDIGNVLISVHCQVVPQSSGDADNNSFITSLSALHSSSGDEYHMVHNDHDDITDVHSANSPANTPPPIVLNRKRSSPTDSNSSAELEDSPDLAACTGGKYSPLHEHSSQESRKCRFFDKYEIV